MPNFGIDIIPVHFNLVNIDFQNKIKGHQIDLFHKGYLVNYWRFHQQMLYF